MHDIRPMLSALYLTKHLCLVQMGIFVPITTIHGRDASMRDNVLSDNLMTGIEEERTLPTLMIVRALCNCLLHNGIRMVAAGLCTQT